MRAWGWLSVARGEMPLKSHLNHASISPSHPPSPPPRDLQHVRWAVTRTLGFGGDGATTEAVPHPSPEERGGGAQEPEPPKSPPGAQRHRSGIVSAEEASVCLEGAG